MTIFKLWQTKMQPLFKKHGASSYPINALPASRRVLNGSAQLPQRPGRAGAWCQCHMPRVLHLADVAQSPLKANCKSTPTHEGLSGWSYYDVTPELLTNCRQRHRQQHRSTLT